MRNYLSKFLIFSLLLSFLVPLSVGAVTIINPLKWDTFAELLKAVVNFLIVLAVPIGTIMIIIAGIYFVTAAGDPTKIDTAKKMILWTFIGLIIIFSAKALIEVIKTIFPTR